MNKINIVRICNFPIRENNTTIEIGQIFEISSEKATSDNVECCQDLVNLINTNNIEESILCDHLFCLDDKGNDVTLFHVSIVLYDDFYRQKRFVISQNGFIIGKHLSDINDLHIERYSVLFNKKEQIGYVKQLDNIYFYIGADLQLKTKFLTEDEDDVEIIKFEKLLSGKEELSQEEFPQKSIGLSFELISTTKNALPKMQEAFDYWRELIFLIYGFFPEYTKINLFFDGKELTYYHFNKRFIHKKMFSKKIKRICYKSFIWADAYSKWVDLRKKTRIGINIFINTIYADTFIEDYPLRLIQFIEGYMRATDRAKKLSLNNVTKKEKSLLESIEKIEDLIANSKEIRNDKVKFQSKLKHLKNLINQGCEEKEVEKSLKEILEDTMKFSDETQLVYSLPINNMTLTDFTKTAKNHRNWFSHGGDNGSGFESNAVNKKAAEKLVLLMRIIMMQDIGITIQKAYLQSDINNLNI